MVQVSFTTLASVAAYAGLANAWFRLSCTLPIVHERIDPVVSPGVSPSQHVHSVHGASNFGPNATYDTLQGSACTNCLITQDKSNYWFPKLFFKDPKTGLFEAVPNGGLLVYYQNRGTLDKGNGGPGLKEFPKGFKMRSGNPTRRQRKYSNSDNTQAGLQDRAVFNTCLRYTTSNKDYETDGGFPNTNCEAGLNARVHMPACWDGKRLEAADNSHVAYLSGMDNGACPSSHPVGFMKLFYEITWDVNTFATNGKWNPATTPWPFVYAYGDPTGYGWHADFQNGWALNVLQNAIDQCNSSDQQKNGITEACPFFQLQTATVADKCKINPHVNEDTKGPFARLPGCNPIQAGPGDATLYTEKNCPI